MHALFQENMFPFSRLNVLTTVNYNLFDNDSTPFLPSYSYGTPAPTTPTPLTFNLTS